VKTSAGDEMELEEGNRYFFVHIENGQDSLWEIEYIDLTEESYKEAKDNITRIDNYGRRSGKENNHR